MSTSLRTTLREMGEVAATEVNPWTTTAAPPSTSTKCQSTEPPRAVEALKMMESSL